jgi:prephenate dehydratase
VQEAAEDESGHRAGIGTKRAADLYGGAILAHDIQDARSNVTRFVVLAPEDAPPTGDDKTSIGFGVPANIPGVLHSVLTELAIDDVQMTKIENRPTKGWLGEYVFLVDFEGHRLDDKVARMLERVAAKTSMLKIFGSYPRFPLESLRAAIDSGQPLD